VAKQTRILTEVGCNVVLFAAKPRPVMQTAVNTTWHIRLITTVKPQVYMRIKQHKHDRHRQPNHTHTHTHTRTHTFSTAHYRHCLHSKRVNVTVGRPSVRLSVCLSVPSFARRTRLLRVCCCAVQDATTTTQSIKNHLIKQETLEIKLEDSGLIVKNLHV